ncbi:MAG TPA: hypothetical protein DEF47_21585 [Herpetosiphon sp.]|uniref:Uncharacterized protein n=1 Tax=Herpetosiphon aurantiacus (strain ATCC 23779 / DSM 785 / 114-95) TaxID=316274 RepID=A9AX00_HERA2|nr:hypothetical protein [Herpetosiphon sp.]ABX04808.1 hypothetical protein Haur_2168 [Herpetosiphon aurantiacus DSM 785]HBW52484.1 hypothetical protein [Herpetosiphon sp.]
MVVHRFSLYLLIWISIVGCQSEAAARLMPQPTPTIPIDTLYFSTTPIKEAGLIDGMLIVASTEELYRHLNESEIQIVYLDQTTVDQITHEALSMIYQKSIVIAAFDIPISMLAKKAGHPQKIPDLELRQPRQYISAIYQFSNNLKRMYGEYTDFFLCRF